MAIETETLSAKTLKTALMQITLDELKNAPNVWAKLSEAQQDDLLERLDRHCGQAVRTQRLRVRDQKELLQARARVACPRRRSRAANRMTLAARHLQTRRPRKDRDVTWSRGAAEEGITWVFYRRDFRRAIHMRAITLLEEEAAGNGEFGPRTLRQAWRELRDLVDEIDLAAMEIA